MRFPLLTRYAALALAARRAGDTSVFTSYKRTLPPVLLAAFADRYFSLLGKGIHA